MAVCQKKVRKISALEDDDDDDTGWSSDDSFSEYARKKSFRNESIESQIDEKAALRWDMKPYNELVRSSTDQNSIVDVFKLGDTVTAEFQPICGRYVHKFAIAAKEPYVVEHITIPDGSLKGRDVILFRLAPPFRFIDLPSELRIAVYRLVFGNEKNIAIDRFKKRFYSLHFKGRNRLAILKVNKEIRKEALHELYHGRTFHFRCANSFARFFSDSRISAEQVEAVKVDWFEARPYWTRRMATMLLSCKNLASVKVNLKDINDGADTLAQAFKYWLMPGWKKCKVIDIDRLNAMEIQHPDLDKEQEEAFRERIQVALCKL